MRRRRTRWPVLGAAVVLLAGCASGEPGGLTTPEPTAMPTTAAPGTSTPAVSATSSASVPTVEYIGDLVGVSIQGEVSSTGNSFGIRVTADDVEEAGLPTATMIYCVGGTDSGGSLGLGQYLVSALDLRIEDGVRMASLSATEEVTGPGTYPGTLQLSEADGDQFTLEGDLSIAAGMLTGSFELASGSAVITGTWACEV